MLDESLRRRLLLTIWVCFVARGLFYAGTTPLWEGFDEYQQFATVQAVATGAPAIRPHEGRPLSREIQASLESAPLARGLASTNRRYISHDEFWKLAPIERDRREAALHAIAPSAQNKLGFTEPLRQPLQAPLYYWTAAPFYSFLGSAQLLDRVFLLRILNVLIASVAVPLAFFLGRTTLGDDATALCAAAAFSAMPQVMFNVSHLGIDALALALATGIMLVLVKQRSRLQAASAGLLLAAGLLTKSYFVALLVASILVLVRHWRLGLLVLAIPAGIAGWWYIRNWSALGSAASASSGVGLWRAVTGVDWLRAADFGWNTLIWTGNWSYLGLRSWVYRIMLLLFLAALFGLSRKGRDLGRPVITLVVFQGAMAASLVYHALDSTRAGGAAFPPGWNLASLAAGSACLLVYGFRGLSPTAVAIPASVFVMLDLYGAHVVLTPYYAGLISFSSTGRLAAFPIGRWSYEVFDHLGVDKPYWLSSPAIAGLWAAYTLGTFALLGIAVWLARAARVDVCRSAD